MRDAVLRKAAESRDVQHAFFAEQADRVVACARAMRAAFDGGGHLYVMGNGGSACDAQHVAVEFMHPVLAKRRALPAHALTTDGALLTALGNDSDFAIAFADPLRALARPGDIALAISTSGQSASIARGLESARELSMLTVGFTGCDGGQMPALCEHCFVVPSFSIHRIQEVHAGLLHVLWDLVHLAAGEEDLL